MRKLLTVILVMIMMVSLLTVSVAADEDNDTPIPPPITPNLIVDPLDTEPYPFPYTGYLEQRSNVLVSRVSHDNVGVILRQLLISHDQLTSRSSHLLNDLAFISQYDILFLNCGASADPEVIRAFVEQGGLVYASDLTMGAIISHAFPEMEFTYASYFGVVEANILDEGLRVQLGGRRTTHVMIPGGGNVITGWSENAELKVYMDFVHSVRGNIPIIAAFEHGEGRVIFTGFHHHTGQTPSDMRRILSHLAFGLYLEDEITAITEKANERGFNELHPIFGSRPLIIDMDADGEAVTAAPAPGAWAAGGGGAWAGDAPLAAPPAEAAMAVFDGEGSLSYVEFENFVHRAIEGETFAIFVAVDLGDFIVHLTSPDGYTYTNENEGFFSGTPPVFTQQPFTGSIEDLGDEMVVLSLGAEGLVVVNSIVGNWEFAVETKDEDADMFAIGLALGFSGNFNAIPDQNEIVVILNGVPLTFDVAPKIVNNRALVPMRAIFEALGASVNWHHETQQITASNESYLFGLQINNYQMTLSTAPDCPFYASIAIIELEVPPIIVGSRTLVPLRAVSEVFGARVDWCSNTRTITVTTD